MSGRCAQDLADEVHGAAALRRQVRRTEMSRSCACAPAGVRLPPQTLRFTTAGRMACSPIQFVASISGSRKKVKRHSRFRRRCFAKRALAKLVLEGAGSRCAPSRNTSVSTSSVRPGQTGGPTLSSAIAVSSCPCGLWWPGTITKDTPFFLPRPSTTFDNTPKRRRRG